MTNNSGYDQTPKANEARLQQVLDAYGADPVRWPAGERVGLQAIAAAAPENEAINARQLDNLLDTLPEHEVSVDLSRKILAATPQATARSVAPRQSLSEKLAGLWTWGPVWRPAAAIAFLAVVTIALEMVTSPPADQGMGEVEVAQVVTDVSNVKPVNNIELAVDAGTDDMDTAWVVVIDETIDYSGAYGNDWEVGFDPAGIELTGFVTGEM